LREKNHRHLFHSKNICPLLFLKEEEGAYIKEEEGHIFFE
jgi:hypothetical protein